MNMSRVSYQSKLQPPVERLVLTKEQRAILVNIETLSKRMRETTSRANLGARNREFRNLVNEYLRSF